MKNKIQKVHFYSLSTSIINNRDLDSKHRLSSLRSTEFLMKTFENICQLGSHLALSCNSMEALLLKSMELNQEVTI